MKRLCHVFTAVLLTVLSISACGPAVPTAAPPTQVAEIESQPTLVRPAQAASTPLPVTPASSTGCPAPAGWSAYTVKSGDTLYALAKQTNQTPEELMRANCLTSSIIGVGVTLYLPLESCTIAPPEGWGVYLVRSGNTLAGLAAARQTSVAEIKRVNCLVSDSLNVGQRLYLPPVPPAPPAPPAPVAPGPIVQPQTSSSEPELQPVIFYAYGAEGPGNVCQNAPEGQEQAIRAEGLRSRGDALVLCLYGFSKSEYLTVTTYTPDRVFGADRIQIITNTGWVHLAQSGTVIGQIYTETGNLALFPWWPLDLPATVEVQVDPGNIGATIQNANLGPRASFLPSSPYAPFGRPVPDRCLVMTQTLPLQLVGAGFPAQKQIPIGRYYTEYAGTSIKRLGADKVMTDGTGHFTYPLLPKIDDSPGYYYVVAITDLTKDTYDGSPQIDCYKIP